MSNDIESNIDATRYYVDKIIGAIRSLKKFDSDDCAAILYEINSLNIITHNSHQTKKVYNRYTNTYISIDENIADLVKWIWSNGIMTCNSCEDNVPAGYVWIEFQTSNDLRLFLDIVFEDVNFEDDLYIRAFVDFKYRKDAWMIDTDVYRNEDSARKEISVNVSLRFPSKDVPFIQEKLERNWIEKCQNDSENIRHDSN